MEWDDLDVQDIRLEETRSTLAALMEHLKLRLQRKQWHDGGVDYRVVPAGDAP